MGLEIVNFPQKESGCRRPAIYLKEDEAERGLIIRLILINDEPKALKDLRVISACENSPFVVNDQLLRAY